ncbi:MAG: SDR family NAD(P)-dependent oxidoreductase [Eubacterium sp.]|nr:SDR family NAD(P)-dependent oxidoreductase [Eubacterium sp.]
MKILITGASRGVGRAIAIKCADSGRFERIIINAYKNSASLNETAQEIMSRGVENVITTLGDVGDIKYIESIYKDFGPVDVVINNAAVAYIRLLTDMSPDEWDHIISTNITSLYNTCHTYTPYMIRQHSGHIINISSVWGRIGASCEVAYSASKGAVDAFTRALAKELAPSNVQVNAVALGVVDTEMNSHLSDDEKAILEDEIPAGRMATADEAADAVLSLLNMPPYFTGEVVSFDGGWY